MLAENKVSISIPEEELNNNVNEIIGLANSVKPYLITLSPDDRVKIPKMGEGTVRFVDKTLDYAGTNPEFMPVYVDVEELRKDVKAVKDLMRLYNPLKQLISMIDDTMMEAGSEAYIAALAYYNSVKEGAKRKVDGAKIIADDLGQRFAVRNKSVEIPSEN